MAREDGHVAEVAALPCNSWGCEACCELNRKRLKQLAIDGRPSKFLTLPIPPQPGMTPDQEAQFLVASIRRLIGWMRQEARRNLDRRRRPARREPRDGWPLDSRGRVPRQVRLDRGEIAYLVVLEEHESGRPHAHLLMRAKWIEVEWLREAWRELTGGHRVQIARPRTLSGVAWYVASYLKKAPKKFDGCTRFWRSLNWRVVERDKKAPIMDRVGRVIRLQPAATTVHEYYRRGYHWWDGWQGWCRLTVAGVPP